MKLKYIKLVSVFLVGILLLSMAGCGEKPAEIDTEAMLQALLHNVKYDTELSPLGDGAELFFPGLPQGSEIKMYTGSGYFADEVVMLSFPDGTAPSDIEHIVDQHVQELRRQFMNYIPEELGKIDHAQVVEKGNCVFICVTNDYENVETVLKNAEKGVYVPATSAAPVPSLEPTESPATTEPETEPPTTESVTEPVTEPVTEVPADLGEYPAIKSASGTFYNYGTGIIRVDNGAFELYGYQDSSAEEYAKLVSSTADALSGTTDVYDLVIPTAIGVVLPDDIRDQLTCFEDQQEAIANIYAKMSDSVIPVHCFENLMKHRDEYLYFRTDYHWNGKGAYYAYESFCGTKGTEPIPLEERTEYRFDDFVGGLYGEITNRDEALLDHPDTVYAYGPKSPNASMHFIDRDGKDIAWDIITDVSEWDKGTKYSTFAGADNPISIFTNPDVTDDSVCIVVKESFGNALMPYLADHYSVIYEIDYRYWEGNLVEFAVEKGAEDLIFANNLAMVGNNYLIGMLGEIIE